jgi:hypothetical protein
MIDIEWNDSESIPKSQSSSGVFVCNSHLSIALNKGTELLFDYVAKYLGNELYRYQFALPVVVAHWHVLQ